jgi:hypothetical protein
MINPAQHRQWLHTSFIVNTKSSPKSDLLPPTQASNLRGRRVWSKSTIFDASTEAVVCQANTAGTVAFHDKAGDMAVRWDTGRISLHSKDSLLRHAFLIGLHRTLQDHIDCLANRCQCAARKA